MQTMNYQQHALDFQIKSMTLDNALEQYASVVRFPSTKHSYAEDGFSSTLSSLFSGLGSSISNFVSSHIDTSSITGFLGSLADILVPGALWSGHPILSALMMLAQELGYPLHKVLEKIYEYIKSMFVSGQMPSIDTALSILPKTSSRAQDTFEIIRYSCSDGTFIKIASSNALISYAKEGGGVMSWVGDFFKKILFIDSDDDKLKNKEKPFEFSDILGWAIKGILLAALTSWGVSKLKGGDTGVGFLQDKSKSPSSPTAMSMPTAVSEKPSKILSTGAGELMHNQSGKDWVIKVPEDKDIREILLMWIHRVYGDQLNKYEDDIVSSDSFEQVARELKTDERSGGTIIYIPKKFTSIKQIVDSALSDTFSKIK